MSKENEKKEKVNVRRDYNLSSISKKGLKKEHIKEIMDDNKSAKKLFDEVAEKEVEMYVFKKKKSIKAIYIFDEIKEDKEKVLKINKVLYTKDVTKEEKDEMKEIIINELKETIGISHNIRVDWGDTEIVPQTIEIGGKYNIPLGITLFVAGIIISTLTEELIFSIIGFIIALTSGAVVRKK